MAILYPGGEVAKNNPGLLGCAENALGLRDFLERHNHELVVLTDKESELDRHLPSIDVLVTTPFWPAYVTKERISNAPNWCRFRSHRFGRCCCKRDHRGRDYR